MNPSPEIAERLAIKLRDESCGFGIGHALLMQEAADIITSQAVEIERLREALEPFSVAADVFEKRQVDHLALGLGRMSDSAAIGWGIQGKHVLAARAALNPSLDGDLDRLGAKAPPHPAVKL